MRWPKLKPRPIVEDERSRAIYIAIIEAGRPLTARELLDATGTNDGRLYPNYLQPLVHNGILADSERDGDVTYDLTARGFKHARAVALS